MKIAIERAVTGDIGKLIEVQNKGFYEDYVKYGECPSYNESDEVMLSYINNLTVYKIIADGEIVGDIIVRPLENNRFYLRVISIMPEYQNIGIGTIAMEHIEKDNPAAVEWTLTTPHLSFRNHHFYEKLGYVKVGESIRSDKLTLWHYRKTI